MKKNELSLSGAPSSRVSLSTINRKIAAQRVEDVGEIDATLAGRLSRVLTIFNVIRPLLVLAATLPIVPPASRSAVAVFVQSLDAFGMLALPGDEEAVADFKAGRDL
jgi:hypothetical protein